MSLLLQDIKYALRRLSRAPVFSSFAIAILAIGIGLNVTVFGVVDALLFRSAPFTDPERIVHIYQDSDAGVPTSTAYPAYRDIAAMTDVFAAVAATRSSSATWETPDGPRQVLVDFATSSYFPALGLSPSRGRWFDAENDTVGAPMAAVVTDKAWRTRFGSDPTVVGRTIRLNNQLHFDHRHRAAQLQRGCGRDRRGFLAVDLERRDRRTVRGRQPRSPPGSLVQRQGASCTRRHSGTR